MKRGWVLGLVVGVFAFLGCGGLLGVVAIAAITAIGASANVLAAPAEDFLAKVGGGDTAAAYQGGAGGLRAGQSPDQFAASVKAMRLDQYQSARWHKFDTRGDNGTLEGTVTLRDGSAVPVTVALVREGTWKVLGVRATAGGSGEGGGGRLTVPAEAELKALVNRDMGGFHRAVKADDFTPFHASLSKPFRDLRSAEDLRATFAGFVDKKIDLSAVEKVDPALTKPAAVDGRGVMLVTGEYPTRPIKIAFELSYVSEAGGWRLIGLNVRTELND